MSERRIGFIGTGTMGSRMAPHLSGAGFQVHVFDIDQAAANALARAHEGITVEPSAASVAAICDHVITMLPAGKEVRAAAFGDGGLVEGFDGGGVLIDMSSSEPWLTTVLAADLAEKGVALIDAPVSGGIKGAEDATLTVMVGGADEVVLPCLPFLKAMAGHVFRTGKVGSGHALKSLNNLLSGMNMAIAAEALLIGKRFGLDPEIMVDVINQSTGVSGATMRNFKQHIFNRRFEGGFPFDLRFKDFAIAMQLARETGTPAPISGLGFQLYEAAGAWLGPDCDNTEIVRWQEHLAGAKLTAGE
ncbi:MAG: NAD(P)-dependent oxidoreductase [Alphaproteobacteria bacterium]